MNKKLLTLIGFLFLLLAAVGISFSSTYLPLRYQVDGITNKIIQKNIDLKLQNLKNEMHFPYSSKEIKNFYAKAPKTIQDAIMPYGYFKSEISSSLTKTPTNYFASFNIQPGPTLKVSSVNIQIRGAGNINPEFIRFKNNFPMEPGSTLNTEEYEHAKTDLNNLATKLGFFNAKMIKSEIKVNLIRYSANITLIFDTGPRFRFGQTTFGKTHFKESFLRHFITYKAGEFYDAQQLEKTQSLLVASSYFNQVIITPQMKKEKNGYVPIHIGFILRKAKSYTFGAGYGTDTGLRGTIGIILRKIGHMGHRFEMLLRASEKNGSFVAKYMIPGFNPARDLFTIGAGYSSINQSTGRAKNEKVALSYTFSSPHWKEGITLAYLDEKYDIESLFPFPIDTQLIYPTFDVRYLNSDNPLRPNEGMTAELQLAGATSHFFSETSFFQSTFHLKMLYTIRKTHTRLLFRSDLGHTIIKNLLSLPLSLQLFAGGSESLRGYDYNSIGPGQNLVVGSAEVQQRVYGNFYLAAFVDAGVVGDNRIFNHVNIGVGPGVVWLSPVGALELTVANAISQKNTPWVIQFTMGSVL